MEDELHVLMRKLDDATSDNWSLLRLSSSGEPRAWSVRLEEGRFCGITSQHPTPEAAVRGALQYFVERAQRLMAANEDESRKARDELARLRKIVEQ